MPTEPVVLVSGGAGNLGRSVTRALLQGGARVAVPFYRTDAADALDFAKSEWGDRLHTFALDLTTERGAEAAVRQTAEWGGGLDAVCHLVGGFRGGMRLADTPLDVWERMLDLNLRSAWLVTHAAIPALTERGGGSLVYVGSRAAIQGHARRAAYSVSKAGLVTLAAAVAEEYAAERIRANVVLPGMVDTPDNRVAMPDAEHSRWTSPEQIAQVIQFLISPTAEPINGTAIPVYGQS